MSHSARILLLGGHGRVALKLTPMLLQKPWHVTSVVRDPAHVKELQALAPAGGPGKLEVLVESLDDVKTEADAARILDRVRPQWVLWCAGAGGKGGADRTYAIDRDAAKAYIRASGASSCVVKFLMVSYIGSRRASPPWWTDEDRAAADHVNTKVLPDYYQAKVDADEELLAVAERRRRVGDAAFQMINLRPGTLTDDPATGKVHLGKTSSRGKISREDVAAVAVALLERKDTRGYFDLLQGESSIEESIDALVKEKHDGTEGEALDTIYKRI